MSRIEVVRGSELAAGDETQGIIRRKAFESENAIVSQSQVAPGVVSGWHHHGTRQLYGFIVSGRLQLEYFLRRQEIADLNVGDFFHIPAGLVHRDLNPKKDRELVVVNILVGSGPAVINVDSPSQGDWMIQLRPNQGDLQRLKEPFGKLLLGDPPKTMPELNSIISRLHPRKVVAVGDVVSRETYAAGIRVDLRIIDHISMRKPTATFNLKPKTTYHVKNPAGVITLESWEAIKRAMKDDDAVILVDGEEDLLALPCIVESPNNSLVLYGQPSQGLVVVDTSSTVRNEASLILSRMTREETSRT